METSLRLRGAGGLRIHAKEKLPLGYNSLIQAHGEMDAGTAGAAAPSYLALFVRQFYPQKKRTGAVEFAWTILDLRKGQDVRLKLGYEFYDKVTKPLIIYAPVVVAQSSFMHNRLHVIQCMGAFQMGCLKINTNKSSVLESHSFSYIQN
ncbi:outer envelope pore protein 21, chloroplastic-like isoform X3 [Panicum virgatum]|uniref:outer envelope pore protein 21, chloroplastic-like isoform X3 n=1 Tax=Panicum virgatum TaxID=38727 RepID=UPI0019D52819|nr:outer envelope pore protein 21, chloroplastic-like isoform X3 [Panicum virgatum]